MKPHFFAIANVMHTYFPTARTGKEAPATILHSKSFSGFFTLMFFCPYEVSITTFKVECPNIRIWHCNKKTTNFFIIIHQHVYFSTFHHLKTGAIYGYEYCRIYFLGSFSWILFTFERGVFFLYVL